MAGTELVDIEEELQDVVAPRCVGSFAGHAAGPTLICVGGIHGDEPAGVLALRRVFDKLQERRPPFRGELVGLAGNRKALAAGQRFLARDLNRIWSGECMRQLEPALRDSRPSRPLDAEGEEQWELLEAVYASFERARGEIYFLDLHTSSADGEPFVCIGDTLRNRAFARGFPVPVILGLEECIDGALLEYLNDLGLVTMGVEAGQHQRATSVDHHEAFIWLALLRAGNLAPEDLPWAAAYRRRLRHTCRRLPAIMEVRHRHPIEPEDEFHMEPGFRNFQMVDSGQLLARDRQGEIFASEAGRILLPLYQGLGSDGFFITCQVRALWLQLSRLLRHLPLDPLLRWLPGVRRHARKPATLIVDRRTARWFAIEIFHLLG
ncbi:MAG: succinylglutamate desuccinylase/aspartoacylase family protein, partial [Acidobacteriota bacterium]